MRPSAIVATVFGLLTLSAAAQAAPLPVPGPVANPAITLAAGGCGPGFAPRSWVDAYGRPHTRCVAIRRPCGPGWHWATWRDAYGRVHSRCVPNR